MNSAVSIRKANKHDIAQLLTIEQQCFATDRLSKRSFSRFIKAGSHDLLILEESGLLRAYVLLLYRAGTNLARLYSIAVLPVCQGRGYARLLLESAENAAKERLCIFLRLEVNVSNKSAIHLYQKMDYHIIGLIPGYYEDGADAHRMEKRLHTSKKQHKEAKPYYQQTTEFTCGPASLMMALQTLRPSYEMTRFEELQIWREATTIFMMAGHGGCSPHGLALSAWNRGFNATLFINQGGPPFLEGVRDDEKKSVIQLVHEDFIEKIRETNIALNVKTLESRELEEILESGKPVLALISTWLLNRNKVPHWVYVAGSDETFVYINDPDINDDALLSQTDFVDVPIEKSLFFNMAKFGQKKLRCLLVLSE